MKVYLQKTEWWPVLTVVHDESEEEKVYELTQDELALVALASQLHDLVQKMLWKAYRKVHKED